MAFRMALKILTGQLSPVEIDLVGIGLMDYEPHPGAGNAVCSIEHLKQRHPIALGTLGREPFGHGKHAVLRFERVLDGPVAGSPTVSSGVPLTVEGYPLLHLNGFGALGL